MLKLFQVAYKQKLPLEEDASGGVEEMIEELRINGFPLPYESIPQYERREFEKEEKFKTAG